MPMGNSKSQNPKSQKNHKFQIPNYKTEPMFRILPHFSLFLLAFALLMPAACKGSHDSCDGLLMVGYQGWFNTPGDGAGLGWKHYASGNARDKNAFRPGAAHIDFWPDVSEYAKTYDTAFRFADGRTARVFSSFDESTVDTHFRWMREYGIDGAFVQRFVSTLKHADTKKHCDTVLASAMKAAAKYDRAVCVMYDLSGMKPEDAPLVIADIKALAAEHHFEPGGTGESPVPPEPHGRVAHATQSARDANPAYLWQNGRPLVAVWGVGFPERTTYSLDDAAKIIGALKQAGFSIMLGVPAYWRTLTRDCVKDPRLHALIKESDVIMPWFVGRYNGGNYSKTFPKLIADDLAWCKANNVTYMPLSFPGFSWRNMKGADTTQTPRDKGRFFWEQLTTCARAGASCIYVAMFDEMDEGTAIFKCAAEVPAGAPGSTFVPIERGIPNDYYLQLAGEAAKMLREPPQARPRREIPNPKIPDARSGMAGMAGNSE